MSWWELFRDLVIGVLGSLVAADIFASKSSIYAVWEKYRSKTKDVCRLIISTIYSSFKKIYSSLTKISFLAETKRIVSSFAIAVISCVVEIAFDILPKFLLIVGFIYAVEYLGKHHVSSHRSVTATECNCPKSTKSDYVSYPTTYSYSQPSSKYVQSCNTRLNYQKPVSNSTKTTVVAADCFSGQKSKKNKGAEKLCAIITSATSLGLKDAEPQ